MPRHWRTVHKSPHKIVMVKPHSGRPRNRHHHTTNHHTTTHVHKDVDWSWLWPLLQVIVAAIVTVFVLAVIVEFLINAWPFIVIGFILLLIFGG